jgi:hypothetical protein
MIFERSTTIYDVCQLDQENTREKRLLFDEKQGKLVSSANSMGVWRVRAADKEKWKNSLEGELWNEYLELENQMRLHFRGIFQYIPRKRYNANNSKLLAENLEKIKTLLEIRH